MRIRGARRTGSQGFWPGTLNWLRSRRGRGQFALACGVGLMLAFGLGTLYNNHLKEAIQPRIEALFAEAGDTADPLLVTNDLPNLYFDIGFEELQIMAAQRDEALDRGILLLGDADWLRADIRYGSITLPVRIRLKGDWLDHLGESKWSFRVQTRNDTALMGMRSFSVQSPETRAFLLEWLFLEDLRRAGILAPRYSFVNVFVNGDDWGVYALEESFSKELLESQGRREGIILRFDETLLWERRALYGGMDSLWKYGLDPVAGTYDSPAFAEVDEFNTNQIAGDPLLKEQRAAAFGLLRGFQHRTLSPSEAFDAELLGRYLAHTNLWGARHNLIWHNERYYYNPLTARLEPIGYDAMPLEPLVASFTDLSQYDDLSVMVSYAQEVARIAQPGYLEELRAEYDADYARYYSALLEEFDPHSMQSPWELLAERQALLVATLLPPQTIYAYLAEGDSGSTTEVLVGNILRYPVSLQKIKIAEQATTIRPEWLAAVESPLVYPAAEPGIILRPATGSTPRFVTLQVPNTSLEGLLPAGTTVYSNTVQIVTNLYGMPDPVAVDAHWLYPPVAESPFLPAQPSLEEALTRHPFLSLSESPEFLELEAGSWQVDGDLVLPAGYGLLAAEPATLAFDQDAIMFSSGPLILQGPAPGSIGLQPKEDGWAGLFVLQTGESRPSILHNVEIRATSGISRHGWQTTGGVTFYESPVELSSVRLIDSIAEDTINVVRTRFDFVDVEFGNAASDAFDGDFVNGQITHCAFHDIRGDAIDVSGSRITIDGVSLLRVHDKGLSAGEASTVTAQEFQALDVGIAIASKDMSTVTVETATIERAWVAGFAAFVKKMEYGPASLRAGGVAFLDGSRQALVQTGSSVVVNGTAAAAHDLDVAALYAQLEALGRMQIADYRLGGQIRLLGYAHAPPVFGPEGHLRLWLYWLAEARPDLDYTVFVHVVDEFGNIVAQKDNMPRDGASPTSGWQPGDLIDDLHTIPLPADLPAGEYNVIVGLYDWTTSDRLPVRAPDGHDLPSGAILLDPFRVSED